MQIKNYFFSLLLLGTAVFAGCEKNETELNEVRTFESFQEFQEWAGDRLVVDTRKTSGTYTVDSVEYKGTFYVYAQNESQRIFVIDESEITEKKTLPVYTQVFSSWPGGVNCSLRGKDCNSFTDEDGTTILHK